MGWALKRRWLQRGRTEGGGKVALSAFVRPQYPVARGGPAPAPPGTGSGENLIVKGPGGSSIDSSRRNRVRISWSVTIVFAADNTPVPCIAYRVPPDCTVRVRANNGTTVGNAQVAFATTNPTSLKAGHGTPLAPFDDVEYPVDNTCRVWGMGKTGDGLTISVVSVPNPNL